MLEITKLDDNNQPVKDITLDAFSGDELADMQRVYGPNALFDKSGAFTLVHLDSPSAVLRASRLAEFNPDEYFFDDCPLCQHARDSGGHIVFDSSDDAEHSLDPNVDTPANADDFEAALQELTGAAIEFDNAAKCHVPEWLADRIGFDILILADSIRSYLEGPSGADSECVEAQIDRARRTLTTTLRESSEPIGAPTTRLSAALDAVEWAYSAS